MKPVYQTSFYPEDGPNGGNCVQAALASLLEMPIEAIPHFLDGNHKDREVAMQAWLRVNQGLYLLRVAKEAGSKLDGHHLTVGKSPRGCWQHMVVSYKGEMVHDPHPDGTGLEEIDYHKVPVKLL